MAFAPSKYQQGVFDFITHGSGDAIVAAVAGSGKTTTLVQAAQLLKGQPSVFLAFNKHIAEELSGRLIGTGMVAKTMHSVGNGMLRSKLGKMADPDDRKYMKLIRAELDQSVLTDERSDVETTLKRLVNLARLTLTDADDFAALEALSIHHGMDPFPEAIQRVRLILNQGIARAEVEREIDFTDMIWLPVIWGLQPSKTKWVLVDECQDLNAVQRELAFRLRAPGGRMLFVGDDRQAIYGFTGADADCFDVIKARTGAVELPLSICYRCPSSHLDLARAIVPQIEARPDAPVGELIYAPADDLPKLVREGDLILCRMTAPLITECIRLIKNKVTARVRGRDIGKDLIEMLRKVEHMVGRRFDYEDLPHYLEEYEVDQIQRMAKRDADENEMQSLRDKIECLEVCFENFPNAHSIAALGVELEGLFSDTQVGVWLSTIHKAKGLENDRVFILAPEKLPLTWERQLSWQFEQEMNLKYVALTRAKQTLIILGKDPGPKQLTLPEAPANAPQGDLSTSWPTISMDAVSSHNEALAQTTADSDETLTDKDLRNRMMDVSAEMFDAAINPDRDIDDAMKEWAVFWEPVRIPYSPTIITKAEQISFPQDVDMAELVAWLTEQLGPAAIRRLTVNAEFGNPPESLRPFVEALTTAALQEGVRS